MEALILLSKDRYEGDTSNPINNWGKIAAIIAKVMEEGKREPHKGVYKKVLEIGGIL